MDFYASGEEVCLPVESDKEQDIGVFGYRFLPRPLNAPYSFKGEGDTGGGGDNKCQSIDYN